MRVYSGKLDAGSYVLNTRSDKKERISRLYQMHANKQNPIDAVEAGDIAAGVGFKDLRTGDTLCDLDKPIVLESMTFPDPVIGVAIEPKSQKDLDKLDWRFLNFQKKIQPFVYDMMKKPTRPSLAEWENFT